MWIRIILVLTALFIFHNQTVEAQTPVRSFSLDYARAHAKRGNIAGVAGQVATAVMEEAHAIVCERSEWVCNEKRLIETSGLSSLNALFAEIPNDRESLVQWVDLVADQIGVRRSEAMPWKR